MERRPSRSILDIFKRKEKPTPALTLDEESILVLRQIVQSPNPRLAETPFLGIAEGEQNVSIIAEPDFDRDSGLVQIGQEAFKSSTDLNELNYLFDKAFHLGRFEDIRLLGHLHPSGKMKIGRRTYSLAPSESLLDPSDGDKRFLKGLIELNPNQNIEYYAIAGNSPDGPKVRIWYSADLIEAKKARDIERIPSQDISLL